jgi:hypothetical protein
LAVLPFVASVHLREPPAKLVGVVLSASLASGCMALSPQLPPTDFEALERVTDREERDRLYTQNAIYRHREAQGTRYSKGNHPAAAKTSWQSLDVILRSDENASATLPSRELGLSRLFTALTVASAIVTVAGGAASAREGLDLKRISGTGAVLLGGGIATVAFGITAGILYGRARRGYERAVDVYNDSLGVRLGVLSPSGEYVPPKGVLVDSEGFVVLDQREAALTGDEGPAKPSEPAPEPAPEGPPAEEPAPEEPAETPEAAASPETGPEPAEGDEAGTKPPEQPAETGGGDDGGLAPVGLSLNPRM